MPGRKFYFHCSQDQNAFRPRLRRFRGPAIQKCVSNITLCCVSGPDLVAREKHACPDARFAALLHPLRLRTTYIYPLHKFCRIPTCWKADPTAPALAATSSASFGGTRRNERPRVRAMITTRLGDMFAGWQGAYNRATSRVLPNRRSWSPGRMGAAAGLRVSLSAEGWTGGGGFSNQVARGSISRADPAPQVPSG